MGHDKNQTLEIAPERTDLIEKSDNIFNLFSREFYKKHQVPQAVREQLGEKARNKRNYKKEKAQTKIRKARTYPKSLHFVSFKDQKFGGGYKDRKEFRKAIEKATWSEHGNKHIKARTIQEAKDLSRKGNDPPAQYLPGVDNQTLEKEGLRRGILYDRDNGTLYFLYDTGKIIGFDGGVETSWIRAEFSSGTFHGHPIAKGDRIDKYLRKLRGC